MFIRFGNDVQLIDLFGPPAKRSHAVLNRPDREILLLPVLDQGLDVLGLQGPRPHPAIAHCMQLVGRKGQYPFPVPLRGIAAFPTVPAQLLQIVVQVLNRVFSFPVSVSGLLAAWAVQDSRIANTLMGHDSL